MDMRTDYTLISAMRRSLMQKRTSRSAVGPSRIRTQITRFGVASAGRPGSQAAEQNGGSVRAAVQPIGNALSQPCLTGLMKGEASAG